MPRRPSRRAPLLGLVLWLGAGACSAFEVKTPDAAPPRPVLPLAPPDLAEGDLLGAGVAATAAGDLVAVGAPGADQAAPSAGAVDLFRAPAGGGLAYDSTLVATSAHEGDAFGAGLALSATGDLLAVGAPGVDVPDAPGGGIDAGAVLLFVPSGATWQETAQLTAPEPRVQARFGSSLSFAGPDLLVVGAPGDPHAGSEAGAAYLFARQGQSWAPL